ncbi:MAG: hypothetical protein ACMXYC_04300 [Candidatus Woesearchaeota archaeon]
MVTQQQAKRMKEFVAYALENHYNNLKDHEHGIVVEDKTPAIIFLHTKSTQPDTYNTLKDRLKNEGYSVGDIFYKDGTEFFKLLSANAAEIKRRRTFSDLENQDVRKVIRLKPLEKMVHDAYPHALGVPQLMYYQPESERLEESIALFNMCEIIPNYDHLDEQTRRYVTEGEPHKLLKRTEKLQTGNVIRLEHRINGLLLLHTEQGPRYRPTEQLELFAELVTPANPYDPRFN